MGASTAKTRAPPRPLEKKDFSTSEVTLQTTTNGALEIRIPVGRQQPSLPESAQRPLQWDTSHPKIGCASCAQRVLWACIISTLLGNRAGSTKTNVSSARRI